jgi:hypothetical protein
MSTGLHTSLSGSRSRQTNTTNTTSTTTNTSHRQTQGHVEENLSQLGLLGNRYTRKKTKRIVQFAGPAEPSYSTCSRDLSESLGRSCLS